MQKRRDVAWIVSFALIIISVTITISYLLCYKIDPSLRIKSLVLSKPKSFKILSNKHSSVSINNSAFYKIIYYL
jgi:hypothetical protein